MVYSAKCLPVVANAMRFQAEKNNIWIKCRLKQQKWDWANNTWRGCHWPKWHNIALYKANQSSVQNPPFPELQPPSCVFRKTLLGNIYFFSLWKPWVSKFLMPMFHCSWVYIRFAPESWSQGGAHVRNRVQLVPITPISLWFMVDLSSYLLWCINL